MILKQLGKRVKQLRSKAKLSQEAFALQAGLNRTYISKIEKGNRNISLKNLEKIANAFGITVSALLDFSNKKEDK